MKEDKIITKNQMNEFGGRLISRRRLIQMGAGATGLVTLRGLESTGMFAAFAQSTTTVVATPALTEGPYFVDEKLNRSDIRVDTADNSIVAGLPLLLGITVSQLSNGVITPLPGATVDVWHASAAGKYSDEQSEGTTGHKYLRGYQVTNAHGSVRFLTIYPGWYSGRAVHIHSKVRLYAVSQATYSFTSQFFFDENITDQVYTLAPYNQRGTRNTRNSNDSIYVSGNAGSKLLLRLAADGSHAIASYHVVLNLAG